MYNKLRINLKNLSAEDRIALKNGTQTLSAFIAGGGFYHLFGIISRNHSPDESDEVTYSSMNASLKSDDIIEVETDLDVMTVEENISFSEAFAQARAEYGPGGFFEWKGNGYNTYYKEELESLSDKNEFYDSFTNSINQETVVFTKPLLQQDEVQEYINNSSGSPENSDTDSEGFIYFGTDISEEVVEEDIIENSSEGIESEFPDFVDDLMADVVDLSDESKNLIDQIAEDIIDFGEELPDNNSGEASEMTSESSSDLNDDGIIDFGATDMEADSNINKIEGVESVMTSLDKDNDGIIDFGAQNIDAGFATLEEIEPEIIHLRDDADETVSDDEGDFERDDDII